MSISSSLDAIRGLLDRETGLPVRIGLPHGPVEGLFVWPYRLVLNDSRAPLPPRPGIPPEPPQVLLDIPLLVLARPAYAASGLDALDAAIHALMANPILAIPQGRVAMMFDSRLSAADLSALFSAARLQQGPALECVARTTITREQLTR